VPTAPLCGTLTATKWATVTAFPASRVHSALFFERPALTARTAWGRAKPLLLAASNPSDATRRNACAPVQDFAAWIASRRPYWTKRARKAEYKSRPTFVAVAPDRAGPAWKQMFKSCKLIVAQCIGLKGVLHQEGPMNHASRGYLRRVAPRAATAFSAAASL
jgi:hypothetical protein